VLLGKLSIIAGLSRVVALVGVLSPTISTIDPVREEVIKLIILRVPWPDISTR
jgi:hypothetical protein